MLLLLLQQLLQEEMGKLLQFLSPRLLSRPLGGCNLRQCCVLPVARYPLDRFFEMRLADAEAALVLYEGQCMCKKDKCG